MTNPNDMDDIEVQYTKHPYPAPIGIHSTGKANFPIDQKGNYDEINTYKKNDRDCSTCWLVFPICHGG